VYSVPVYQFIGYSVQGTILPVYIVQYIVYSVQCSAHSVPVYNVKCTGLPVYNVQCTPYSVPAYTVPVYQCIGNSVQGTSLPVYRVQFIVYSTVYNVLCTGYYAH